MYYFSCFPSLLAVILGPYTNFNLEKWDTDNSSYLLSILHA